MHFGFINKYIQRGFIMLPILPNRPPEEGRNPQNVGSSLIGHELKEEAAASKDDRIMSTTSQALQKFAMDCERFSFYIPDRFGYINYIPSAYSRHEESELLKEIGSFLNKNIHLIGPLSPFRTTEDDLIRIQATKHLLEIKKSIQQCKSEFRPKLTNLIDKFLYTQQLAQQIPLAHLLPAHPQPIEPGIAINILFASLSSETSDEIANSIKSIKECPSITNTERNKLIAEWINKQKIPLTKLNLNPAEIEGIAPYLKYLDCSDLFQRDISNEQLSEQLNRFPNLTTLIINNLTHVTHLPAMPQLETLNCSWCGQLRQLPNLSLVRDLDCSMCYSLEQLPALPLVTTLNCSWCQLLTQLPNLSLV